MLDDNRKIGIALTTGGVLFTVLGVLMFFDRGLLAMGNVRAESFCHYFPVFFPVIQFSAP